MNVTLITARKCSRTADFLQDLANRPKLTAQCCSIGERFEHLRAECGMAITRHHRRGTLAVLLAALTVGAGALAGCGTDASSGGSGSAASGPIQIWEGYTGAEATEFAHLVSEYEAQHPGQKVSPLYVNNDDT